MPTPLQVKYLTMLELIKLWVALESIQIVMGWLAIFMPHYEF
jgi:hypothetical protein